MGAEAKFLPNNDLDINDNVLDKIDVLFFACHGFPNDLELFKSVVKNQFKRSKFENKIKIWAHPGRFFKKYPSKYEAETMKELIEFSYKNNILIEINIKDQLLDKKYLKYTPKKTLIIGHDIHTKKQLNKYLEN